MITQRPTDNASLRRLASHRSRFAWLAMLTLFAIAALRVRDGGLLSTGTVGNGSTIAVLALAALVAVWLVTRARAHEAPRRSL